MFTLSKVKAHKTQRRWTPWEATSWRRRARTVRRTRRRAAPRWSVARSLGKHTPQSANVPQYFAQFSPQTAEQRVRGRGPRRRAGRVGLPRLLENSKNTACLPNDQRGALLWSFSLLVPSPARHGMCKSGPSLPVGDGTLGFCVRCVARTPRHESTTCVTNAVACRGEAAGSSISWQWRAASRHVPGASLALDGGGEMWAVAWLEASVRSCPCQTTSSLAAAPDESSHPLGAVSAQAMSEPGSEDSWQAPQCLTHGLQC